MRRIALAILLIFCGVALLACEKKEAKEGAQTAPGSRKLNVVTTLFPVYDFTKAVAGDKAQVTLLLPPGVEPHSFEPRPEDMVRVSKADVVIYTNKYMEPWAVKMLETIPTKPEVVEAGKGVTLLKATPGGGHEHGSAEEAEHGGIDPHIWLDFQNAQLMVQNIAEGLIKKDPANRDYYLERAKSYQQELAKLDEEFKSGLSQCRTRTFLEGGHYAFGYLAHRYDLNYQSAQALNPDSEPTPQKLAELVREVRKNGLKYVYCEELLSPATADMIARETGTQVLLLNAAHNVRKGDLEKGVSFISLMHQNLENLRKGMECR